MKILFLFINPLPVAQYMFFAYATFVSGNGGVPEGGSKGIIDRMAGLYHDLGGKIFLPPIIASDEIKRGFADYSVVIFGHVMNIAYLCATNITKQNDGKQEIYCRQRPDVGAFR